MERKITINLVRDGQTISCESLPVSEAKERLATKLVNRFQYVIDPPDATGAIPGDDARYAADCEACGVENPYATCVVCGRVSHWQHNEAGEAYCPEHEPGEKHTPTPWRIESSDNPNGCYVLITSGPDDAHVVADCLHPSGPPTGEQARANAEFIVRAVNCHEELLALARATVEFTRTLIEEQTEAPLEEINDLWNAASDAIAKVEGTPTAAE